MAGTRIQMKGQKQLPFSRIHQKIHYIQDAELVSKSEHCLDGVQIWLLVYEKYYLRTGSYASVSVLLMEHGQEQYADIVASGGGGGLVNHSYGANRNLAKACAQALEECGFAVTTSDLETPARGIVERFLK